MASPFPFTSGQVLTAAQLNGIAELTDYSGSITFNGFTLGNGTVVTSYARVQDLVAYSGRVTLGSTSSMTGPLDVSLPLSAASLTNGQAGVAYCDNPFRRVAACAVFGNVNNMRIFAENYASTYSAVTDVSSTVPFTWASTHTFGWNLIYLAA